MTTPDDVPKRPKKLRATMPYVWVAEVAPAVRFYQEVLGFTCDFTHDWEWEGKQFGLAVMSRDGVQLELRTCECPDERHTGKAHFKLEVHGIDELYAEWKSKGATFSWKPLSESWGIRNARLEDPDGNFIYLWEHL